MTASDLLTVQQAAQQLRLHPVSLYRIIQRGDLAHYRLGRRVMLHPNDVRAYVEGARVPKRRGA